MYPLNLSVATDVWKLNEENPEDGPLWRDDLEAAASSREQRIKTHGKDGGGEIVMWQNQKKCDRL